MMQCILYKDLSYSNTHPVKTVFFASFIFMIIMNLHFQVQLLHKENSAYGYHLTTSVYKQNYQYINFTLAYNEFSNVQSMLTG